MRLQLLLHCISGPSGFYHMHISMGKTWKNTHRNWILLYNIFFSLDRGVIMFSGLTEASFSTFCCGTAALELGLQWVGPWRWVFVCFRRSSIMTRLPLNTIAVSSHRSLHQQTPATQGLTRHSGPFIHRLGISYLIGHWWVALFPGMLMAVGWCGSCEPLLILVEFQTTSILTSQRNTQIINTRYSYETGEADLHDDP